MQRRIVITGIGLITPLGNTREENWEAILAGRSGVAPITAFDASRLSCRIAGQVRNFDPSAVMDPKELRHTDRFIHFAIQATSDAIQDAGLVFDDELQESTGVIYGSGMGGLSTILANEERLRNQGPRRVSPFLSSGGGTNMAAGIIAIHWGLRGPNYATVSACSTSAHAVADGFYAIARGDAEIMVTGGSEAIINELTMASFGNSHVLSTRNNDPQRASRPFDSGRDGFVLAEGGATLILEELGHALARGAKIYAEISGVGMTADAYHITAPSPQGTGAAKAMIRALDRSGLPRDTISYINAHATSTKLGDASENTAIKAVFGPHAYRLAVSATKSMTGHLLGAAGATEAAYTAMALYHQIMPPTMNLENPDPDCDLDYVPNRARSGDLLAALSNSNGFGGANISLAFKRYSHS